MTRGGEHRDRRRIGAPAVALGVMGVLAVGVLALGMLDGGQGRRGWLAGALSSGSFRTYALVALASAAGLTAIGAVLARAGRARRTASDGEDGAVIVEFALALPFAMMLALLMIQSALLMAGNVCVHYAAFCAARTAAVTVPMNIQPSEPPNVVGWSDSAKNYRIRSAAIWAVMPVSSGHPDQPGADVGALTAGVDRFFGVYGEPTPQWADDKFSRMMWYAREYTDVELAPPYDGDAYAPHEDLTVTVRHTLYLAVPFAGRILAAMDDPVELGFAPGALGLEIEAQSTMPNEGAQDYVDVETFDL